MKTWKQKQPRLDRIPALSKLGVAWLERKRLVVLGVLLAALAALGAILWLPCWNPPPAIPIPQHLAQLEPQLKAYIEEKTAWVKAGQRDAQRHATLGLIYAANDLWREARVAFLNSIQLNPHEPLAYLYEAISCLEMEEREEGVARLRQLCSQFPQFAAGFYRLGDALARQGAYAEAGQAFQRLVELAPGEWRGFSRLGECKMHGGNMAEAVAFMENGVRLAPQEKLAHHLLGQAYQRIGRTNEATREMRLGLEASHYPMADAWSIDAYRHMKLLQDQIDMAREFTLAGQPWEAVAMLSAALQFNPTNVSLLNNLGIALNQAGQPAQAKELLARALRVDARYVPCLVAISASCLALGQTQEAMEHANRALALNPQVPYPHISKANILLALERDSDALKELEAALRCDPKNAALELEQGDICLRNMDRPLDALDHYRRAIALDPALVGALERLVQLERELGHVSEANKYSEELRKFNLDNERSKSSGAKGLWKGRR
jgi:tetratricopeptide (TPR) repeat protein